MCNIYWRIVYCILDIVYILYWCCSLMLYLHSILISNSKKVANPDSFNSGGICLSNLGIFWVIIFDVLLFAQIVINLLFNVFNISNKVFFIVAVKLSCFNVEHNSIHFSADFIFSKKEYQFLKMLNFFCVFL